jgi:hypothetical protein
MRSLLHGTPNNVFVSVTSVVAMTFSLAAEAAPAISSSTSEASAGGNTTITIQGSGFGEKAKAAPVLFDQVDASYENGIPNLNYQALTDGTTVPSATQGQPSVWADVSSGAWGSVPPKIISSQTARHENSSEQYLMPGQNSTIARPVAYGGASGWDTPVDNTQLYVSWWYKPKYAPQWYWRVSPTNPTGEFQNGETLTIGGVAQATFIGIDSEGQINLVFKQQPNKNELLGTLIRGESSGATSIFPETFVGSGGSGYETPGSQKYIRVWEDPQGKEGIRFSWTQMHQTLGSVVNWSTAPVIGGEWNHLEMEMDTQKGLVRLFVNSKQLTSFNFDPSLDYQGRWSPTVAMLGLNGKVGKLQESQVDDIYIDNSIQRVILGNAPTIDQVTRHENQRQLEWSNSRIKFQLYQGAIENLDSAYLYVYDSDGLVNFEGYPICSDCKEPPAKIDLFIE